MTHLAATSMAIEMEVFLTQIWDNTNDHLNITVPIHPGQRPSYVSPDVSQTLLLTLDIFCDAIEYSMAILRNSGDPDPQVVQKMSFVALRSALKSSHRLPACS